MAFAKIVGLDVIPTTWLSVTSRFSVPLVSSGRLRSSSQTETPAAVSSWSGSGMAHLRLFVGGDQGKELGPRGGVVAELAVQCRGDCVGAGRSYAAYGHAQVLGCHDDTYAARRKVILEPVCDLLGQPFLHLGAAGEQLDYPSQLRQAENPLAWQVADVSHPDERQQVMLTYRLHRNGARNDQLVISGVVGECGQVERAWTEHLGVRPRHPSRGRRQTLGVEVHSECDQERGCGLLRGDQVGSARRLDNMQRRTRGGQRWDGIAQAICG